MDAKSAAHMTDLTAWASLGLIAVLREDLPIVRQMYTYLEPSRGSHLTGYLVCDTALGLLAMALGDLDQAVVHFEDTLLSCNKTGNRPELARICCDYADTLLQRNEPGDRERAMSLLDESLAISSELGMRPLMERVLSRREILKA